MKCALFLVPMLFAATPAVATGGLDCRSAVDDGPRLLLTIGHGAGPSVVGASLSEGMGDLNLTTNGADAMIAIGQSWIDERRLWLDLTDRNVMRYEARLRLEFQPRGRPAIGTLERGGRTYQVRCVES